VWAATTKAEGFGGAGHAKTLAQALKEGAAQSDCNLHHLPAPPSSSPLLALRYLVSHRMAYRIALGNLAFPSFIIEPTRYSDDVIRCRNRVSITATIMQGVPLFLKRCIFIGVLKSFF